ncbi:MAG: hypothetical protein WC788_06260 [Candidatus Paceibacterota bacterium]|jgi:hypothetical protein
MNETIRKRGIVIPTWMIGTVAVALIAAAVLTALGTFTNPTSMPTVLNSKTAAEGAFVGFSYEKQDLNSLDAIKAFINGIDTKDKTVSIDAHRRPLVKVSATDIAGYKFLGWNFDGVESKDDIQNPTKTTGFSPVEYAFASGETTSIVAIYEKTDNTDGNELKFDHVIINWE